MYPCCLFVLPGTMIYYDCSWHQGTLLLYPVENICPLPWLSLPQGDPGGGQTGAAENNAVPGQHHLPSTGVVTYMHPGSNIQNHSVIIIIQYHSEAFIDTKYHSVISIIQYHAVPRQHQLVTTGTVICSTMHYNIVSYHTIQCQDNIIFPLLVE